MEVFVTNATSFNVLGYQKDLIKVRLCLFLNSKISCKSLVYVVSFFFFFFNSFIYIGNLQFGPWPVFVVNQLLLIRYLNVLHCIINKQ